MDRNRVITINRQVEIINAQMQRLLEPHHIVDDDGSSSCIFRVPQSLLEINKEAYQPQIVSIGPYHDGKDLPMIKEHKWRYLNGLIKKTDAPLKSLLNSIVSMEKKIRQSYSETILHCSEDLAIMMVLDGVFLIEFFRKFGKMNHEHQNDPIFQMVWVIPFLMRDFLRIENQIPFFVLQELFDESQTEKDVCTLPSLILKFFNYGALRPKEVLSKYVDLKGEHVHLLDFFRKSFLIKKTDAPIGNGTPSHVVDRPNQDACPERMSDDTSIEVIEPEEMELIKNTAALIGIETSNDDTSFEVRLATESELEETMMCVQTACTGIEFETSDDDTSIVSIQPAKMHLKKTVADNSSFESIQPATKLVVAGVKFKKKNKAKSFLDIKFKKGVLFIPQINLDDFYTHFILNGMIFEQCYSNCSKDITTYIVFLGCLINTSMDVGLLSDRKIIQNYLGTDEELVKFFNNVVKYVAFDVKDNYLIHVFKDINGYCDDWWQQKKNAGRGRWNEFKHTYFESPWTFISAFAAFVLLCLTTAQTFYTIYPYYYERI